MAMTTTDLSAAKRFLEGMSGGVSPTPVLAAVSGGLDSMCLLHLLSTWGRERNMAVTAAHFNHQLRGAESDRDEEFVRDWCVAHEIPFVSGRGDVAAYGAERGLSVEEAARDLRYAFLAEQQKMLGCTFILTAHHADDNAETMLLNLLRGTGLRGLTGIPEGRGCIARPFLQVTRAELAAYAEQHHVPYVEDSTNALDDAARNVLRHQVLPVLRELNPRAVENMTRTAELLAEDEAALAKAAERLLTRSRVTPGCAGRLPVEACKGQPKAVVSRCVWNIMVSVCGHRKDLSAAHVEGALQLLRGLPGKEISLPYGMVARREEDALCICLRELPASVKLEPDCPVRWGGYTLTLLDHREGDGLALRPGRETLTVTPCDPGERMTLPGTNGSRTIKRLCTDRRISLAERDELPAIRADGKLAALWRLGVDLEFLPEGEPCRFIQIMKQIEERHHEK